MNRFTLCLFLAIPVSASAQEERVEFLIKDSTSDSHLSLEVGSPTPFMAEARVQSQNQNMASSIDQGLSGAILPIESTADGVEAFIDISLDPTLASRQGSGACQRPVVSTKTYGVVYERFQWGEARTFCFGNGNRIEITAIKPT